MKPFITVDESKCISCGTCFVSLAQIAIRSSRKCKEFLNLRPADKIHAVLVVGYPEAIFLRSVPRDLKPISWRTA